MGIFTNHILTATIVAVILIAESSAYGQVINENHKFMASDREADDHFGLRIAIDDGIIVIGVSRDDDNGTNSGSAYVFDAYSGLQLFKLLPADGEQGDEFGSSVAIDEGIIVVGASNDDDNGSTSGSAYLFDAFSGAQLAKLLPSDGKMCDSFGIACSIDNGIIAIGAVGSRSAYLFDAITGLQLFKLTPSGGVLDDAFGDSISIHQDVVCVGAFVDDENGLNSGAAYLFDVATGTQIAKLLPSDGEVGDGFGYSLSVGKDVVVVGSRDDDDNGAASGSAYFFDAQTGEQLRKIYPNDASAGEEFGYSVSIDNGVVAVGAYFSRDNGMEYGSAYLYDATTGVQLHKLLPSGRSLGFSISIAIDNGVVAVGAPHDEIKSVRSGSAYVFDTCPADVNLDGVLTPADFTAWIAAFNANERRCDQNSDGLCETADFTAWIANYNAGC